MEALTTTQPGVVGPQKALSMRLTLTRTSLRGVHETTLGDITQEVLGTSARHLKILANLLLRDEEGNLEVERLRASPIGEGEDGTSTLTITDARMHFNTIPRRVVPSRILEIVVHVLERLDHLRRNRPAVGVINMRHELPEHAPTDISPHGHGNHPCIRTATEFTESWVDVPHEILVVLRTPALLVIGYGVHRDLHPLITQRLL